MRACSVLWILSCLLLAGRAGAVVYVDLSAPGPAHDGASWDTAFLTIQEGVDAATPDGEVWVADGTYVENVVMGEGVQLYGGFLGAEPSGYETTLDERNYAAHITTIDGNQSGSCVVMAGDTRTDGFTVTNGSGTVGAFGWLYGGGFYSAELGEGGFIANNVIVANEARRCGGGIYCQGCSPVIVNNVIVRNAAGRYGGGISCSSAAPTIVNNTICDNSAALQGGGFYCSVSPATISNNIVIANSAGSQGGGIYTTLTSQPTLSHNDFWGNTPTNYHELWPGDGDISEDPRLENPEAGDFHIDPLSPCVDAGDNGAPGLPTCDFEGQPRVVDGNMDDVAVVDIGADELAAGVVTVIDLPANDPTIPEGSPVEFAGTAFDTRGLAIVDYLWSFGQGSGIPDMHLEDPGEVVFSYPGVFTVVFDAQAEDGSWAEYPDTRTVTVQAIAPQALIDSPPYDLTIEEHQEVEFAGTGTDGNGYIVGYLWTFGEGSGIPDMSVEDPGPLRFDVPGEFVVTFNAQDNDGNWDPQPDTRLVTVEAVPPEAVIDAPCDNLWIDVGDVVEFAGTATDANGYIVGYLWTFGTGSGIEDMRVEDPGPVQFNNPGLFEVTFNAQDDDGRWDPDPDTRYIRVGPYACVFVDQNAPGPVHDGSSWDTALLTVQDGVDAEVCFGEVWVADGTYVENVVMGDGVQLYGGFLGAEPGGYETSLDQRDFVNHIATIDGAWSGSCVFMAADARVDGFTLTRGFGTRIDDGSYGGGIYCVALGERAGVIANNIITGNKAWGTLAVGGGIYCRNASPLIAYNVISGNWASGLGGLGGGICCVNSSAQIIHNTIQGNWTEGGYDAGSGGGLRLDGSSATVAYNTIAENLSHLGAGLLIRGDSSPVIADNVITGNEAADEEGTAGGICIWDGPAAIVTGNTITYNEAGWYGGGVVSRRSAPVLMGNVIQHNEAGSYDGGLAGGIFIWEGSATLTNNVIARNIAYSYNGSWGEAGGMGIWGAQVTLTNNVVAGNVAESDGGGLCLSGGSTTLANNIVVRNVAEGRGGGIYCAGSVTLSHNDFWLNLLDDYYGCAPGPGDISLDPKFVSYASSDFHLTADSPCVDAGDNSALDMPESDYEGETRIFDGDGDRMSIVDIGADELVIYENAQAPNDWFVPGWVWFSAPLVSHGSADASDLLGFDCTNRLYGWDDAGKNLRLYPDDFTDLMVGPSYVTRLDIGEAYEPVYEGSQPLLPFEWSLPAAGWCWVGVPGTQEILGTDLRLRLAETERSAQEDRDAPDPWLNWNWIYWDPIARAAKIMEPFGSGDDDSLHPWWGYRVWVNPGGEDVTLVFP